MSSSPTQAGLDRLPNALLGLVTYPRSSKYWWLIAATLGGIAILAALWYVRRKAKTPPSKPDISPLTKLRTRLHQLRTPSPFTENAAQTFYFELDMILREFIELSSPVEATGMTVRELRRPLRERLALSNKGAEEMLSFLARCERIKFAQSPSDLQEAQLMLERVIEWSGILTRNRSEANSVSQHE